MVAYIYLLVDMSYSISLLKILLLMKSNLIDIKHTFAFLENFTFY